ncbi:MAG: tetratricopeptide repeat protein, partial [Micropruina sp.]|uniref:tetratricopeptide repeat protein n=1 Tax=Micropruina sp. TaxID=2737536 RepID=UPI0039E5A4A2
MTLSRRDRTPDQVLAAALRSLQEKGWDDATRRYAEDAWAGHELAAGDASGAVVALVAVSSRMSPTVSRDRWQQYLEPISDLLGVEHPDTLTTRHNLAFWRGRAGDAAGAAAAFAELLPIRERVLGVEHPDTLRTRNNLASWRGRAGDAAGAAAAFAELLPIRERVLGAEHPDT